jgi:hypothetical protein
VKRTAATAGTEAEIPGVGAALGSANDMQGPAAGNRTEFLADRCGFLDCLSGRSGMTAVVCRLQLWWVHAAAAAAAKA